MKAEYRVIGEWLVIATSPEEAATLIENAVACSGIEADLENCDATLENDLTLDHGYDTFT